MEVIEYKGKSSAFLELLMECSKGGVMEFCGLEVDLAKIMVNLQAMIYSDEAAVFVLQDGEKIAGFIGVQETDWPTMKNKIITQHYWYMLPEYRNHWKTLLNTVKSWARERGCASIILCTNTMTGQHGRLCRLYERIGGKKLETQYVLGV